MYVRVTAFDRGLKGLKRIYRIIDKHLFSLLNFSSAPQVITKKSHFPFKYVAEEKELFSKRLFSPLHFSFLQNVSFPF